MSEPGKAYEVLLDALQGSPVVSLAFWTGEALLLISIDGEPGQPESWRSHVAELDRDEVLRDPQGVVTVTTAKAYQAWHAADHLAKGLRMIEALAARQQAGEHGR